MKEFEKCSMFFSISSMGINGRKYMCTQEVDLASPIFGGNKNKKILYFK